MSTAFYRLLFPLLAFIGCPDDLMDRILDDDFDFFEDDVIDSKDPCDAVAETERGPQLMADDATGVGTEALSHEEAEHRMGGGEGAQQHVGAQTGRAADAVASPNGGEARVHSASSSGTQAGPRALLSTAAVFKCPMSSPKPEHTRFVLHVDIDCFYCQAEALRRPDLRQRPVVVCQFNSGGYVAVNYEARACGLRKGDGVGAGGRAHIPALQGRISAAQAREKCPGLVELPMDVPYYKDVSERVLTCLQGLFGCVEQASIDDFYVEVTELVRSDDIVGAWEQRAGEAGSAPGPPPAERVPLPPGGPPTASAAPVPVAMRPLPPSRDRPGATGVSVAGSVGPRCSGAAAAPTCTETGPIPPSERYARLTAWLWAPPPAAHSAAAPTQPPLPSSPSPPGPPDAEFIARCLRAARVAEGLRRALRRHEGLTCSVGVSDTKLAARLCSAVHKPDGQTLLPGPWVLAFMAQQPIRSIPSLQGLLGARVCARLPAVCLGDLRYARVSGGGCRLGGWGRGLGLPPADHVPGVWSVPSVCRAGLQRGLCCGTMMERVRVGSRGPSAAVGDGPSH